MQSVRIFFYALFFWCIVFFADLLWMYASRFGSRGFFLNQLSILYDGTFFFGGVLFIVVAAFVSTLVLLAVHPLLRSRQSALTLAALVVFWLNSAGTICALGGCYVPGFVSLPWYIAGCIVALLTGTAIVLKVPGVVFPGVLVCLVSELLYSILRTPADGGLPYALVFCITVALCFLAYGLQRWKLRRWLSWVASACLVVFFVVWAARILTVKGDAREPSGAKQREQPNVILIVLDTLRRDRLGCYGGPAHTPAIDGFARDAVLYRRAYATASWTLPSVTSILTGMFPARHGAHRPRNVFDGRVQTLADLLRAQGYATMAATSGYYASSAVGLGRGFEVVDDVMLDLSKLPVYVGLAAFANSIVPLEDWIWMQGWYACRVASQVNATALRWFDDMAQAAPFFCFLHYFDVHHPYFPYYSGNQSDVVYRRLRALYADATPNYVPVENQLVFCVLAGSHHLTPSERGFLLRSYDGEIAYLDGYIAKLLARIRRQGLYDRSLIIITADHGESFGEHGLMKHGFDLYEDNIRVPLLIKYPGNMNAGMQVDKAVSLAGIVPTVLDIAQVEHQAVFDGRSFACLDAQQIVAQNYPDPAWADSRVFKRFLHATVAAMEGEWKYIWSSAKRHRLFHLSVDPGEMQTLIDVTPVPSSLCTIVERISKDYVDTHQEAGQVYDPHVRDRLRALGYLQ